MDEDAAVDESPPTSPARSVRARAASPPAAERKEEVDISTRPRLLLRLARFVLVRLRRPQPSGRKKWTSRRDPAYFSGSLGSCSCGFAARSRAEGRSGHLEACCHDASSFQGERLGRCNAGLPEAAVERRTAHGACLQRVARLLRAVRQGPRCSAALQGDAGSRLGRCCELQHAPQGLPEARPDCEGAEAPEGDVGVGPRDERDGHAAELRDVLHHPEESDVSL